jgi:hypothetical protein
MTFMNAITFLNKFGCFSTLLINSAILSRKYATDQSLSQAAPRQINRTPESRRRREKRTPFLKIHYGGFPTTRSSWMGRRWALLGLQLLLCLHQWLIHQWKVRGAQDSLPWVLSQWVKPSAKHSPPCFSNRRKGVGRRGVIATK